MPELVQTSHQEWIKRRVDAVQKVYSAYDALTEHGYEIPDRHADFQLSCGFHGPDTRPSARYYGSGTSPHFHCYTCKIHEYGVGLYARLKGLKFMDALKELERRFDIKIPKRPESHDFKDPTEKGYDYKSEAWSDVPRVLEMLEKKLMRLRGRVSLIDFVRFCKVIDAVQWDLNHNGNQATPEMVAILTKVKELMDQPTNADII
jgi:hypothetical protein